MSCSVQMYTENCAPTKRDAANYLSKYGHFLKWNENKENILEIGCADGYITKNILYPHIEHHVEELKAVDILENMIELARSGEEVKKIRFEVMDVTDDQYIEDMKTKFDKIFSFYCAHTIQDQRDLIRRLYSMVKPGGQIFITAVPWCPIYETCTKILTDETWSKFLPKTNPLGYFGEDPKKYMHNILEETGFKVELCTWEQTSGTFNDFKNFVRGVVYISPFLKYIPPQMQEEYIEDHVKTSCESSVQIGTSEVYNMPYDSLIFIASKKI